MGDHAETNEERREREYRWAHGTPTAKDENIMYHERYHWYARHVRNEPAHRERWALTQKDPIYINRSRRALAARARLEAHERAARAAAWAARAAIPLAERSHPREPSTTNRARRVYKNNKNNYDNANRAAAEILLDVAARRRGPAELGAQG